MRPKRAKSNITDTSSTDRSSKQSKSRKLMKYEQQSQNSKVVRNHKTDKDTVKKESVNKALKINKIKFNKTVKDLINEKIAAKENIISNARIQSRHKNDSVNNKLDKEKPLLQCSQCNRVFKTEVGLRKHENCCPRTNTKALPNDMPHSVKQNNESQNKVDNTNAIDVRPCPTSECSPKRFKANRENNVTSDKEINANTLTTFDCYDIDKSEVVEDVKVKDKLKKTRNRLHSEISCTHCNKVYKSHQGLLRHENNCKRTSTKQLPKDRPHSVTQSNENQNSKVENTSAIDLRSWPISESSPKIVEEVNKESNITSNEDRNTSDPLNLDYNDTDNSEIVDEAENKDEFKKIKNRHRSELRCTHCNKECKSYQGLRRHENNCKRTSTKRLPKDKPHSVTQANENQNNKVNNTSAIDLSSCPTSESSPKIVEEINREINITSNERNENSEPLILECDDTDNSEIVDDVRVKDELENKNWHHSEIRCIYCDKVCKSYQGVRRHEKNCKKKPLSDDRPSSSIDERYEDDFEPTSKTPDTSDEFDTVLNNENKCNCCGEDLETAHTVGDFQCNECSKLFRLKSSLERHIRVIHNGESHECPQCGAKCPDKGTLARHMYTHTGLKPYSCPVCKQEFSRKYHLVRHNMQTGCDGRERPVFPCQVCGREFNRKDNLREHLRAHAGQTKRKKKFTCECCGDEYDATDQLKLHKKIHLAEKVYACDFCPKKFSASGAMKKHRRTHTGERPYQCSTCQRRFAAKETLNRHVRIHTGYKPYSCQYCGKGFIQSSQLKSHLYYHTGQSALQSAEAFVCDLCGRKFNRKARLNEHVKFIHLGAKPFECDQCTKTFIRKEDLNRHRIIHSGVKAHQCPICSKAFAMKSTLKVHLLTHTKEPPRSCDACGRAFIRQDCLLRHMRNRHREMLEEIKSEAEKKKLQQQLLQVAAEASLVEGMEEREELDENGLVEAVRELLTLLVDETTLRGLGWPGAGVEALLEAVIKRCGHEPAPSSTPRHDRLRHNIKLLFTVVIDDSAVKALLNNQTVDEVILHVLRLAKS